MSNHPNRSKQRPGPGRTPAPEEIIEAREQAKLTQTEAAALIFCSLNGWQQWEGNLRRMHPAFWELWRAKAALLAGEKPELVIPPLPLRGPDSP